MKEPARAQNNATSVGKLTAAQTATATATATQSGETKQSKKAVAP